MYMQQSALLASEIPSEPSDQQGSPESQLMESIMLARAMLLARKGKLEQAEALLVSLVNKADCRMHALDLLAKVYAQQQKIKQAQATWLKALEREPSNLHFLSALQLCAYYQNSRFWRFMSKRSRILNFISLRSL